MRVIRMTPLSLMTRMMTTEKRMNSHSTTCTATMPSATAAASHTSSTRWTKTIVATIAPGPASSGVPSGTSATLTFAVSVGLVGLAGEQLEGDQQQEQAAGRLQRGKRDAEVVEDRLAEQREHHDDDEGDEHRLAGEPLAHRRRPAAGQAEEQRDGARRVHDHEERDEDLDEELAVGRAVTARSGGQDGRGARRLGEQGRRGPRGRWCSRRAGSPCRCRGSRWRR